MPSPIYYQLKPDDRKRLKRLKLTMWFFTVLFVVHGMFGWLQEIYPITRWSMYAQAYVNGGVELNEGYFFRWYLVANLSEDRQVELMDSTLAAQFRYNSASIDTIRLNFTQLIESDDPAEQAESAEFFRALLVRRYGEENLESFEVHRHAHLIDYSRFPSLDFETADYVHVMARVSGDGETIEQMEEDITNE